MKTLPQYIKAAQDAEAAVANATKEWQELCRDAAARFAPHQPGAVVTAPRETYVFTGKQCRILTVRLSFTWGSKPVWVYRAQVLRKDGTEGTQQTRWETPLDSHKEKRSC